MRTLDMAWPERGAKALVFLSLAAAIGLEAHLGRGAYAPLPIVVAIAGCGGFVGGRLAPGATTAAIMFLAYTTPALCALALGFFRNEMLLAWNAALAGLLLADARRMEWSVPLRWRFALVLWSVTVAIAWPIVAFRETDFASLDQLDRYAKTIANTSIGGAPRHLLVWIIDVAVVHLLGLVWVDWLFRRVQSPEGAAFFRRNVLWPLAAAAITGSLLAVYQRLVDLSFLGGGPWGVIGRAPGSMMDANAFGIVAAIWTAGFMTLASPGWKSVTIGGSLLCWAGVWMTGSRTSLLAACAAVATAAMATVMRSTGRRKLQQIGFLLGGAAVVVAVALYVNFSPTSPIARIRQTPAESSTPGLGGFVRAMWERGGYGRAATALIREQPLVGQGIGTFNLFGAAYLHDHGVLASPDNAQNWWRQQVAELGVLGAAGPLIWTLLFTTYLIRTSGRADARVPAAWVKGALLGVGLASLVGMPGQNISVTISFWTFACWYTLMCEDPVVDGPRNMGLRAAAATAGTVLAFAAFTLVAARGDLRPAVRAARGGWHYTYGMYAPPARADRGGATLWSEHRGVHVAPAAGPWIVLSMAAEHPDLSERPVHAVVKVNGRTVLDRELYTSDAVVRVVEIGPTPRFILEARTDRTWRSPDPHDGPREAGLSLSWEFATTRPESGVPAITAPGPRAPRNPGM